MALDQNLSDAQVLNIIGERLSAYRLQRNLTQAQMAKESGVSKRTIERLEAGESVQLTNFLRVIRVLERLSALEQLLPELPLSPMEQLRLKGKTRQRASSSRGVSKVLPEKDMAANDTHPVWRWGHE